MSLLNKLMRPTYFECACFDPSHTIRVTSNIKDKELYIEIHLNNYLGFFTRVKRGIKYILGITNSTGDFDCTMLTRETALQLNLYIKDFLKNTK